jgi:hypothetical protein
MWKLTGESFYFHDYLEGKEEGDGCREVVPRGPIDEPRLIVWPLAHDLRRGVSRRHDVVGKALRCQDHDFSSDDVAIR